MYYYTKKLPNNLDEHVTLQRTSMKSGTIITKKTKSFPKVDRRGEDDQVLNVSSHCSHILLIERHIRSWQKKWGEITFERIHSNNMINSKKLINQFWYAITGDVSSATVSSNASAVSQPSSSFFTIKTFLCQYILRQYIRIHI